MLRINHIIKILGSIKSYTPHTYKSKLDKIANKIHGWLVALGLFLLVSFAALVFIYKSMFFFRNGWVVSATFTIYFLGVIVGLIIMALPPIIEIKYLIDWKKQASNNFVCEISHDEENAKLLSGYSEKELLYAIHWLQMKNDRIKTRVSNFFGEKTAILSILGLTYSAVQSSIGFDKLTHTFTQGLFTSGIANTFIILGLAFLLGLSLGALMLKKVANHQLYLKEIVELAIRLKKCSQDEEEISV